MVTPTHLKAILSNKKRWNHTYTNVCSEVQSKSQNQQKETDSQENKSVPTINVKIRPHDQGRCKVPVEKWVNAKKSRFSWLVYKNGRMFCQVIHNIGNNSSG